MELEHVYRHGPYASMGYPLQHYQPDGRDMIYAVPNGARMNRRVCPVRGPIGGVRLQIRGDENEAGQARRRVAVAVSHFMSILLLLETLVHVRGD